MATIYTELPDYNQFVQSYFVDQQLLDTQDVGTVLIQNASVESDNQNQTESETQDTNNNTNNGQGATYF